MQQLAGMPKSDDVVLKEINAHVERVFERFGKVKKKGSGVTVTPDDFKALKKDEVNDFIMELFLTVRKGLDLGKSLGDKIEDLVQKNTEAISQVDELARQNEELTKTNEDLAKIVENQDTDNVSMTTVKHPTSDHATPDQKSFGPA